MSSLVEEPSPPREEWQGYGYPAYRMEAAVGHVSPATTHAPDVSPMFRNLDTSAQVPSFCNRYADREVAERQTRYAEGEPQRKEAALDRWWALFGVVRKRPANI